MGSSPADGPVLVTGASGGVGGTALAILAERGYEVWAATGKPDEADRLSALGAAGILTRDEVTATGKPLESERWAGAVDAVGGGDAAVRAADAARPAPRSPRRGNAGGPKLETTVFPFILRGAALLGMDSVTMPIARRRELWDRLATDLRPRALGGTRTRSRSTRSSGARRRSSPAPPAAAGSSASGRVGARAPSPTPGQSSSPRSCSSARWRAAAPPRPGSPGTGSRRPHRRGPVSPCGRAGQVGERVERDRLTVGERAAAVIAVTGHDDALASSTTPRRPSRGQSSG